MPDQTFTYVNRPLLMISLVLIGAVLSVSFLYTAIFDSNLTLDLLLFTVTGWKATAMAWFFAVFFGGVAAVGIYSVIGSFGSPKIATLTTDALIAPRAPTVKKMVTVPYSDITKLKMEYVAKQAFLQVYHSGGKVSIAKSYLVNPSDFDTIHHELQSHRNAANGDRSPDAERSSRP